MANKTKSSKILELNKSSRQESRADKRAVEKETERIKKLIKKAKIIGRVNPGDELFLIPVQAGYEPSVIISLKEKEGGVINSMVRGLIPGGFLTMMMFLIKSLDQVHGEIARESFAMQDQLKPKATNTNEKKAERIAELEKKRLVDDLSDEEYKEMGKLMEDLNPDKVEA